MPISTLPCTKDKRTDHVFNRNHSRKGGGGANHKLIEIQVSAESQVTLVLLSICEPSTLNVLGVLYAELSAQRSCYRLTPQLLGQLK